jgi:hypothetical protein
MPILIDAFKLQGFRAYLEPQTINLCRGDKSLSLAVFAPNAKGKSSLADALEYYFSEDATLTRLGKRQLQTHAGPLAMENVEADKCGITPAVHLWFRQDKDRFDEAREVSKSIKSPYPLPNAATRVLSTIKVPFIIRGYELRSFIEDATPEDRYKDVASWFALDPLARIQQNLRAIRREVKKKSESRTEENEHIRDLKQITKKLSRPGMKLGSVVGSIRMYSLI